MELPLWLSQAILNRLDEVTAKIENDSKFSCKDRSMILGTPFLGDMSALVKPMSKPLYGNFQKK
jgi:hypothetical protein